MNTICVQVYPVYIFCNTGEIRIKYYDVSKKSYNEIYDNYNSLVSYMNEIDSFIIGEQVEL